MQIPVITAGHNSNFTKEYLLENGVDLLINAGTPCVLSTDILSSVKIGILNIHPGLIPEYRGCTVVEWAIYNDEAIGNTVHFMTSEIDKGSIVCQEKLLFKKTDRYHDIRVKVYKKGFMLMALAIKKIYDNDYSSEYVSGKAGKYYSVIDQGKMDCVIAKINNEKYKYQL